MVFSTLASARSNYRGPSGIPGPLKPLRNGLSVPVLPYFSCGNYQSRPADEATDWKAHRFPLAAWKSFDPWDQAYHLPVLRFFLSSVAFAASALSALISAACCFGSFVSFVHRTSSLFFINFIHDHLR